MNASATPELTSREMDFLCQIERGDRSNMGNSPEMHRLRDAALIMVSRWCRSSVFGVSITHRGRAVALGQLLLSEAAR